MSKSILVIPDAHATPNHHNERFDILGNFIIDRKPDIIVNIGDFADMSSLCVSPSTLILTGDMQWKEAGLLQINDEILGFQQETYKGRGKSFRKFKKGYVTQNKRFISQKGYEIFTTHGNVVCSYDHKFLSYNPGGAKKEFRTCKDLKVGWKILSLGSAWHNENNCNLTTQEIGYLQGFFDGEGYYGNGRLTWSQNDGEVADYVKSLVSKLGVTVSFYTEDNRPKLKHYYIQGSYLDSWKILCLLRPIRLMKTFLADVDGKTCSKFSGACDAEILEIRELNNVEVIGLETSISTYISNSLFSHNCSYDKGKKSFEGRRYKNDIAAVIDAQERMFKPLNAYNAQQRKNSKKQYKPELILTLGNHENRINRVTETQAELDGTISVDDLGYKEYGWDVHSYGTPVIRNGVSFCHHFTSGVMGRPISGEHPAYTMVTKMYMSCVAGHSHLRDFCERTASDGRRILGLVVGCYLDVDQHEDYAGEANKMWWKGLAMLHDVENGEFEPEFINIKQLRKQYA